MNDEKRLRRLDPINESAQARWQQERQSRLWQTVEARRNEHLVELVASKPRPRPIRRAVVAVAAAAVLAALASVPILRSNDRQAVALHQIELAKLTLGDGYLWLSTPSGSAGSAASEFARVVFGWTDPKVSLGSGETVGPSWVSVSRAGVTIKMLLVPNDIEGQRWRMLQLGDDVSLVRRSQADGTTRVSLVVPPGASGGYVLSGTSIEAHQTDLDSTDLANRFVGVHGPTGSVIVVFVNDAGSVVGASGSHT